MNDVVRSANISEILRGIPHRYPFLLIDRVEACEPGKWVRVTKNVSQGDWYFRGIPFERQVMPQVLLLEALAQAAGALCHFSSLMSDPARTIVLFAGASEARFNGDARPGDQLVLECTLVRAMRGVAKLVGTCSVDTRVILETKLAAAIRNV